MEARVLFAFTATQLTTTAAGSTSPANAVASGADVFFTATDPATGNTAVWTSDGTTAGTTPLSLPAGASGTARDLFAATGDSTTTPASVFFDLGTEVIHSDGTAAGTTPVTIPGATPGVTPVTVVGTFNGNAIVLVNNGTSQELWEQNSTSNAPVDLGAVPAGLTPEQASLQVGGRFFFGLGGQLWSTTGTPGDAAGITDTGATSLSDFTALGGTALFQAATANNQQLWASDGTAGGTTALLPTATSVGQITALNSGALFVAQTAADTDGPTLWHTTGTAAGTVQLSGAGGPVGVGDLGVVSGKAFFVGFSTTARSTAVLYNTTGTGITSVRTLGNAATAGSLGVTSPTVQTGDQAAFLAPGTDGQIALWTSFGITNTTDQQLPDAPAGTLVAGGDNLVFDLTSTSGTTPGQLYVLNGPASSGSGVPITVTGALLTPAVTTVSLPSTFVPGDRGAVKLTITNTGDAAATGVVAVQLALANQGSLTSSVPLTTPTLSHLGLSIGVGRSRTVGAVFTVPADVPVGTDQIVATLSAVSNLVPGSVSTTPVTSTATATAALSFGAVGTRRNVPLRTTDAAGNTVEFELLGGGTGTLSTDASGNNSISLTGTLPNSRLVIATAHHAITTLTGISVIGSLNQIAGPQVALAGNLTVVGDLRRVSLASVTDGTLTLDGSTSTVASLGAITNASLHSTDPIATLKVTRWTAGATGGTLNAPTIGTFVDTGAFQGTLASAGNINVLQVRGNVTDSTLLAGANLGGDQALGGGDDTFTPAMLGHLVVLGSVTGSTLVAAGLSVTGDAFPPTPSTETLLAGGRIVAIQLRGSLYPAARILAAALPPRAVVGGRVVLTAGDPNFAV